MSADNHSDLKETTLLHDALTCIKYHVSLCKNFQDLPADCPISIDKNLIHSKGKLDCPHEGPSNQKNSNQSSEKQFNKLKFESKNMINQSCVADRVLGSILERLKCNLNLSWDSISFPYNLIMAHKNLEKQKYTQSKHGEKMDPILKKKGEIYSSLSDFNEILRNGKYTHISQKLESFSNWLLFINLAVFEKLDLIESNCNKELYYWFNWEFDCISQVGKNSVPYIGLGKAHRILLEKLSLTQLQFQQEALEISLSVMTIVYKDFQPGIWNQIRNLNNNLSPEENLIQLVLSKAISEGIMIDQNSDNFYQPCTLDKLKIPAIEVFPVSMKPLSFNLGFKTWFLTEDPVMKKISEEGFLVKSGELKSSKFFVQVDGLPMRMFKNEHNNQYRSRFLIHGMNNNYEEHLTRKIKCLLWFLNMSHEQLIYVKKLKGNNLVPEAISQFRNWFHDVLFKNNNSRLPIFGYVNSENGSFKASDFGTVQIYLINEYFSKGDSYRKVIQVSLALICYWYQHYHSNFFFEEKQYWKIMIESLGYMLNLRGLHSLGHFDYKGNWIHQ
jgi:hypothetical protein